MGYLAGSFPEERVDLAEAGDIPGLPATTVDPDDEHVCALAIAGRADLLITSDRGYLRDALRSHGVAVMRPDEALTSVFDERSPAILAVLEAQAAAWAGGRPVDELLDAIARAGATTFAGVAREVLLDGRAVAVRERVPRSVPNSISDPISGHLRSTQTPVDTGDALQTSDLQ